MTKIWDYTFEKWSEKQADKYYKMLFENFQHIADDPDIGRNYDGIRDELFGIKANRHIIFYRRFNDKPIEIIRILHERMDLKTRLTE
ncbi:MAG: type II toxin-antitoxin system RelE/ParE family toxin [Ferruginibacter sp.]|nr:type II toxin-antitoxin system RelE/ParE family toxin [Ferruginibacter sp.]